MYFFPSWLLTAVVLMFATSEPASGSVIAMHARFLPVKKSGRNRRCNCSSPNLMIGGTPNAMPVVMLAPGPPSPDRDISSL